MNVSNYLLKSLYIIPVTYNIQILFFFLFLVIIIIIVAIFENMKLVSYICFRHNYVISHAKTLLHLNSVSPLFISIFVLNVHLGQIVVVPPGTNAREIAAHAFAAEVSQLTLFRNWFLTRICAVLSYVQKHCWSPSRTGLEPKWNISYRKG